MAFVEGDGMLVKPGTKLCYRQSDQGGWEWSDDGGEFWYMTFRSLEEIRRMHPTLVGSLSSLEECTDTDLELEVFGDTLDEPLPDDFIAMLDL